jgi:hypothetical protein
MKDSDARATDHPQRTITHEGYSAEVDEGIADLILESWRAGLPTGLSCQDNMGRIWIMFVDAEAAQVFLHIAALEVSTDPASLYNRIAPFDEGEDWQTFCEERAWHYDVSVPAERLRRSSCSATDAQQREPMKRRRRRRDFSGAGRVVRTERRGHRRSKHELRDGPPHAAEKVSSSCASEGSSAVNGSLLRADR